MNYWIEKTYSHKRSLDKISQFKKTLVSPTVDKRKADIYKNMRYVKTDDIVLHLDQTVGEIIGFSRVSKEKVVITIDEVKHFRVELSEFTPYKPTINIREIFRDPSIHKQLTDIKSRHEVFYRKYGEIFALRQGAYLTRLVPELFNVLEKYTSRSVNNKIEVVREIPIELLSLGDQNNKTDSISIVIGKNGLGKSKLLADLANQYLLDNKTIIAVSSSIYDKFSNMNMNKNDKKKSFHFIGGKDGPNAIEKLIEKYIEIEYFNNINSSSLIYDVLDYVGYQRKIGIKLSPKRLSRKDIARIKEDKSFKNIVEFMKEDKIIFLDDHNEMINLLNIKKNANDEDIAISFEFNISKNGSFIPLLQASSGELTILTTFIHISLYINKNSVILIDEPENSLHPQWQKNFLHMLTKLFSLFRPKIIIATHSPILISISDFIDKKTNIYVVEETVFKLLEKKTNNHELILKDLFNIITPENRALSNELVKLVQELKNKDIDHNYFIKTINSYKEIIYDPRQNDLLVGVLKIAQDLIDKMDK